MYLVFFSKKFDRQLKKLIKRSPSLKSKIEKCIEILSANPKHSSLRLHKLSGKDNWSISVAPDIRILFKIKDNMILCSEIGSHDEVY